MLSVPGALDVNNHLVLLSVTVPGVSLASVLEVPNTSSQVGLFPVTPVVRDAVVVENPLQLHLGPSVLQFGITTDFAPMLGQEDDFIDLAFNTGCVKYLALYFGDLGDLAFNFGDPEDLV